MCNLTFISFVLSSMGNLKFCNQSLCTKPKSSASNLVSKTKASGAKCESSPGLPHILHLSKNSVGFLYVESQNRFYFPSDQQHPTAVLIDTNPPPGLSIRSWAASFDKRLYVATSRATGFFLTKSVFAIYLGFLGISKTMPRRFFNRAAARSLRA